MGSRNTNPNRNRNRKKKRDKENAASLIADYDTSLPKYDISGYTYLTYPYVNEFDDDARLSISMVFELMRTIYSRITPTPKKFMEWSGSWMSFYCKLCSCFGIDYLHLEAASKDDVVLMTRRILCLSTRRSLAATMRLLYSRRKRLTRSYVLLSAHRGYLLRPRLLDGMSIGYHSILKCVPTFALIISVWQLLILLSFQQITTSPCMVVFSHLLKNRILFNMYLWL
ncbi:hypothetical protein HanRHA438_Chr12g0573211 [Helianthus annuus]|uniref:Uncharacterized protein n=1 Tax=Helianthus annuus TaxID=4232 RepID=A0A9K3HK16_HELAN|nr:hypothetical protein HanXRQr2_Chr12g0562051 [Helianthus annuus]KAJ0490913.1 hypothetical protein HanHA300_Chr12g0461021 [Helianthus annuus]KAJ0506817.1 hypothetical protein HanHA89_Chr12g0486421 [Helianthus annuus]KAJ0868311.1 hypothetical protein HanRHA438_Chr12g0573211 [Helianthus annuus]